MGVRGLSSFIEANDNIYDNIRFRNSKLIIDGSNLSYLLYFDSGLDQRHGGEYAAFQDLIGKFFKALRDCDIEPYVVLDGGADPSDRKYDCLVRRAVGKIENANKAAFGGEANVLPSLVKLQMKQTLAHLKVPFVQCSGEADGEVASLANEWGCPVLSNDSDFFIFNLTAGFLPITHFKWEAMTQNGSQRFIPCKRYSTSSFCTLFNIKCQLLPVWAVLVGNDSVKLQEMNVYPSFAQYVARGKFSFILGPLGWLKGFQQQENALMAAMERMGQMSQQKRAEVLNALSSGMKEYQLTDNHLKRFFTDGVAPPLYADTEGVVPDWTRLSLAEGRLSGDVMDVLLLHRNTLTPAVDDCSLPSANQISRPIRQVIYGLLLGGKKKLKVEELDREDLRLARISVQPVVRGVAQQLSLGSLNKADPSLRLRVLLETLDVSETTLRRLPPHLRLPVAATCYWLRRVAPPMELLQALLMGLASGEYRRKMAATGAVLPRTLRCPKKMDLGVAHAYNQWQSCIKYTLHLNQLLGFPLEEPQIVWLFSGILLHHLVIRLRRDVNSKHLHITNAQLYHSLLAITLRYQPERPSGAQQTPPSGDLSDSLKRLKLLEEEEEEEAKAVGKSVMPAEGLSSRKMIVVKTRYRTKERSCKAQYPVLFPKKGCKDWD